MLARRQGDGNARQDDQTGKDLRLRQVGPHPEPFHERGERRGQTVYHQARQPRAKARDGLIQRQVAGAKPDAAAQEKQPERASADSFAKQVRPNGEQQCGHAEAIKIRRGAAEHAGGAAGEDDGKRKQNSREKSG